MGNEKRSMINERKAISNDQLAMFTAKENQFVSVVLFHC